jgi:hypothetical protein
MFCCSTGFLRDNSASTHNLSRSSGSILIWARRRRWSPISGLHQDEGSSLWLARQDDLRYEII